MEKLELNLYKKESTSSNVVNEQPSFAHFLLIKYVIRFCYLAVAMGEFAGMIFWIFIDLFLFMGTAGWVQWWGASKLIDGSPEAKVILPVGFVVEYVAYVNLFNADTSQLAHVLPILVSIFVFLGVYRSVIFRFTQ